MFPLEFRAEVNHEETRVMGLSHREDRMIVAWVILTQCQGVTDRRTDGRMDLLQYSALYGKLRWRAVKTITFITRSSAVAERKPIVLTYLCPVSNWSLLLMSFGFGFYARLPTFMPLWVGIEFEGSDLCGV